MIKALMVDVDGVLVNGRPGDGRHWQTAVEEDFGFTSEALNEQFFTPYWSDVVLGRAGLMDPLTTALRKLAPHVSASEFVSYWFKQDSRVVGAFLPELWLVRAAGVRVYLATNQEHLRAAYLMETLGLAEHVDGIFYSARLGTMKPELEFFAKIQAAVGLHPEEILLIDDSSKNVDAARKAGWRSFLWSSDSSADMLHSLCRTTT